MIICVMGGGGGKGTLISEAITEGQKEQVSFYSLPSLTK